MKTIITCLLVFLINETYADDWEFNLDLALGTPLRPDSSYYGDAMVGTAELKAIYYFHDNIGIYGSLEHVSKVSTADRCGNYSPTTGYDCDGDNWMKAGLRLKW